MESHSGSYSQDEDDDGSDDTMGAEYDVEEIPADLVDEANEWREKMLENAANFDDELMEMYLEGADIPEEKVIAAIRKGTIAMELTPMPSCPFTV